MQQVEHARGQEYGCEEMALVMREMNLQLHRVPCGYGVHLKSTAKPSVR